MKHDDYTVGWICALATEMAVARAMLDERHDSLPQDRRDHNNYALGRIGPHNIVIACLPEGVMGVISAARVADQMSWTFRSLRFSLMVGIGGGVPSAENDIRLGDVVVSKPTGSSGGVIQYDYGKTIANGRFEGMGSLNRPPDELLQAVSSLKAAHMIEEPVFPRYLSEMGPKYPQLYTACTAPGSQDDQLFEADYHHVVGEATCVRCDTDRLVNRTTRTDNTPKIHYGLIASGSQVMKDGVTRERLRQELNVLCFEMEAAGLMDRSQCLVIRGICDYADTHKNKQWQAYAAASAAAYAKELLNTISGIQRLEMPTVNEVTTVAAISTEAWLEDVHVPLELEYSRNLSFIGRQADLKYIHDFMCGIKQEKNVNAPLVIYGTGGMGKTQLVREYVYAHATDFTSVIWIDARTPQTTQNSFVGFMQKLIYLYTSKSMILPPPYAKVARHLSVAHLVDKNGRLILDQDVTHQMVIAVIAWLKRDGNRDWLLIFDNVDDLETFRISDHFPNSMSGNVILTSRRPEASRFGEGRRLEVMTEQESVSLLSKSYGRKISMTDKDYDEAKRIVEKLGHLPLAIDQAGAYLNRLSKPLDIFLPLFESSFKTALGKKPPMAVWQYGEKTVVTTWEISFEAIQVKDPQAARLLLLCSFLSNEDIDASFLSRGLPDMFTGESQIDDHIATLFSFSLATRKQDSDRFSIHPLVHTWARERLSSEDAKEVASAALRMIAYAITVTKSRDVNSDRRIIQHIQRSSELASLCIPSIDDSTEQEFMEVWDTFAEMYQYQGRYSEAETIRKRALAGYEKVLGLDHPDTLAVVQNLGLLHYGRGKVDEAERMWKRALTGHEKALEPDHPHTLMVVQNLGLLYHDRGKMDEAERMWKRALAGYEKALKPDHPGALAVVQNLGMLYHGRGKVDEAERMWKRALTEYEKVLEPDHPNTLTVVQNLGMLYYGRGKVDEAERMWKRALAGYEKALEPDHPDTLMVVQNLGMLYHGRGKMDEAEGMWKRALTGYERVLEPDHPKTLKVVQNLGALYHGRGKVDEAERMWKRALAGYEKALEPDHPDTLMVVQNLGTLYHGEGKMDEAERTWKRALTGYERVLGPDHPNTLTVVQNLGLLYHGRGKVDEAERVWKRALAGYEKVLEPDNPDTLRVVQNLGMLYRDKGKVEEAEKVLKCAVAGYEKANFPDNKQFLDILYSLGELYEQSSRSAEAVVVFKRVTLGYQRLLGPQDPETLDAAEHLEIVHQMEVLSLD